MTPLLTYANDPGPSKSSDNSPAALSVETVHVTGRISRTLYKDARAKGIPKDVVNEFIRIMNGTVDFRKDIHKNDRFEMAYLVTRNAGGKVVVTGPLLYAGLKLEAHDHSFYRFERGKNRGKYYSPEGQALHVNLKTPPLPQAVMTSAFGARRHPISGKLKHHNGIDLSAPLGTPIFATADGEIVLKKYNRSYGNIVEIQHTRGYVTAYAHMSKFAKNLTVGQSVERGQVIGYVGTTGRSTGPHLHYEIKLGARNMDPSQIQKQSDWDLIGSETSAFKKERRRIDLLRASNDPDSQRSKDVKTLPATP